MRSAGSQGGEEPGTLGRGKRCAKALGQGAAARRADTGWLWPRHLCRRVHPSGHPATGKVWSHTPWSGLGSGLRTSEFCVPGDSRSELWTPTHHDPTGLASVLTAMPGSLSEMTGLEIRSGNDILPESLSLALTFRGVK